MIGSVTKHRLFWPVVVLIALLISNLFFSRTFFNIRIQDGHLYGSLIDIIRYSSPLVLMALGMTLVIATGGVDLSVGSVAAISGALACLYISERTDQNSVGGVLIAVALGIAVAAAAGLWNGLLVARLGIQPIIATLILLVAGRGVAQLITEGQIITINSDPYKTIGGGYILGLPNPFLIAIAAFVIAAILVRRTALGLLIEAVGGNAEASRLVGIRSRRLILLAYVISGLTAGVAGLILSSNVSGADGNNAAQWYELDAILAVVIGGTLLSGGRFYLSGTLLGALIIQTLTTTIYTIGVSPNVTLRFKGIVVLVV
jgi:galactofuranose transport system permease protein